MSDFTCAACQGVFNGTTTEVEKEVEFQETYNQSIKESDEEVVSICDSCYEIAIENGFRGSR